MSHQVTGADSLLKGQDLNKQANITCSQHTAAKVQKKIFLIVKTEQDRVILPVSPLRPLCLPMNQNY